MAVEFFPYRSSSNEYHNHSKAVDVVFSKAYSFQLVRNAVRRKAVIFVRYGLEQWLGEVHELRNYEHLLLPKPGRKTHISLKGFRADDGLQKVVRKIMEDYRRNKP